MLMKPGARPHCGTNAWSRAGGELAHGTGHRDVLGEVEVVDAGVAGGLGHADVAVVRQARHDRIHGVRLQVRGEGLRVARIETVRVQVVEAVGVDDGARHVDVDVGDVDLVLAGFREQAGNQRADLARAEDQDLVHWSRLRRCVRAAILTKRRRPVTSGFFCSAAIRATMQR